MTESTAIKSIKSVSLRVLVIEDSWVLARDLAEGLESLGCRILGPTGHLEKGLDIAKAEAIDGAMLDVNLGKETSFPIAKALQVRGVPFVFLTGLDMSEAFPDGLDDIPRLNKPIDDEDLAKVLEMFTPDQSEPV